MTQQTQSLPQLKIVSVAISISTLALLVVSFVLNSQVVGGPGLFEFSILQGNEMVTLVIAALSIPAALLSLVIPKFLDKTPNDPINPHITDGSVVFYNWQNFKSAMFTVTLVRLALCESIAIYGFVISFLNHAFFNMIPFVMVALYLQFIYGPFFQKK